MRWYEKDFRRILVDSHIADWDKSFQSKFSAKKFVDMFKLGRGNLAL